MPEWLEAWIFSGPSPYSFHWYALLAILVLAGVFAWALSQRSEPPS